jgi:parvulin-like peptidyl-prolyl isomerase
MVRPGSTRRKLLAGQAVAVAPPDPGSPGRRTAVALAALGWLAVVACGGSGGPVATYRGGSVDASEWEGWLRFRHAEDDPAQRQGEVEQLVLVKTLAAAAERRGAAHDPGLAMALAEAERTVLAAALKRREAAVVEVTDAEVDAALAQHPDAFHKPERRRLRNLFKRRPSGAEPQQVAALRSAMEALRQKLAAGADFAALAAAESDSQTRFQGGLMGNVEPGRLRPEIDAAAARLGPGEVSPVLETEDGWTILKCDEVLPAKQPSAEEQRRKVATSIRQFKEKQGWEALRKDLLAAANPRVDLSQPDDGVVLTFTGGRLTGHELDGLLALQPAHANREHLGEAALTRTLQEYAFRVTAAHRARELGLDAGPRVAAELYWRRLQLLAQDELRRRVEERLQRPGPEEVRTYFEAHRGDFQRLQRFDFAVIRLPFDQAHARERMDLAGEVVRRVKAGEISFADAARTYSDLPSASRGGAVGWISGRQLAAFGSRVWKAAMALAPAGGISGVVEQGQGLYVLEVRGYEPRRPMTFEEAAAQAENQLGTERAQQAQAAVEAEVVKELDVRVTDAGG